MVADIHGRRSHEIVCDALSALENLDHRGAAGAEANSGDGAGILVQLPVEFFRERVPFALPQSRPDGAHTFAAGICFLPTDPQSRIAARERVAGIAEQEGIEILGWHDVDVDPIGADIGRTALSCMPHMTYLFVSARAEDGSPLGGLELDRRVYGLRKRAEQTPAEVERAGIGVYFPSLSSRTITFKGMLTTVQLALFFRDLRDRRVTSAIAVVHSRFLDEHVSVVAVGAPVPIRRPQRGDQHGAGKSEPDALSRGDACEHGDPGDLERLFPICTPDASDSASFDEVLELLHLGGRSLPHAVLMMIPEAWENHADMPASLRGVLPVPCVVDGTVGRPGLRHIHRRHGRRCGSRPQRIASGRWWRTGDGRVVLASESGVLPIPQSEVIEKGRLEPGRCSSSTPRPGDSCPTAR